MAAAAGAINVAFAYSATSHGQSAGATHNEDKIIKLFSSSGII